MRTDRDARGVPMRAHGVATPLRAGDVHENGLPDEPGPCVILSKEQFMTRPVTLALTMAMWAAAAAMALAAAPLPAKAQAPADATATQSSINQGVTVKVTPKATGPAGSRWEFDVVLDTHSSDLDDDLVQSASLLTDDGRILKPTGWAGAPAGGHHREGVLAFDGPAPRPATIELRIARPGEAAARTFRWQL
ncbi:MAG TPA: hypothetical protein VFY73_04130 [Ideonella sp.]|uniref:hypothetical protein n=1 Tax=Ideonella sp. TaxID=1929293 RepID=UPI002E30D7F5|nr:hypothetical protein [Ideonella sp.]HEX5683204.1 hypothetical protein [Ideonella sp.]